MRDAEAYGDRGLALPARDPLEHLLPSAGLLDVGWAISMKYAEGYMRPGWSIASLVLLAAFVFLLGRALKVLEIGVAYSVWGGRHPKARVTLAS